MGLFTKTDEEIRLDDEQKKLKMITLEIKNSTNLNEDDKNLLLEYINKIKKGYPNDFHDIDTLIRVILRILESDYNNWKSFNTYFTEVIDSFSFIVNKEQKDYEKVREMFIDTFLGEDGVLKHELFDKGMYAVFYDKNDYFDIINLIANNKLLRRNFATIKNYIQSVSKYCLSQDMLKRDIIAYLANYENVVDKDFAQYSEQQLEEAKRRIGIYNISAKKLAVCDTKLKRVEKYLEQFKIYMNNLTSEKEEISTLVDSGKKEVKQVAEISIEEIKAMIKEERNHIVEKLDAYLVELEASLKDKSDETFRQILETYTKQVAEFRNIFRTYSREASKDLISIQKATQESIDTLQNYVTNEPQLQELLRRADEQKIVREKIIELVSKEEQLAAMQTEQEKATSEQIIIPGYDRVMIPYRHMVLPSNISKEIIPLLDETIPFEKRLSILEERMKEKEKNGEIYHKKIKQIAIDVMEGDWPYLWGPSGTGKSHMVKQVSELLGMPFLKAGKITEPYSILGYNDPQGRYRITPTFIATLYGYLLSLDEFDNGNPDTQVVLNDIYSELLNKLDNPEEACEVLFGDDIPVDINPNFRMIAAGNTSGEGENSVFSSRGKMDESIQERMTPIYIDYDNQVESRILKDYPEWYKFFIDFREVCASYTENNGLESPQGTATTRDSVAIKKYVDHNSKSLDQVIAERFIQIKNSEYRKALGKAIAEKYDFDYDSCRNITFKDSLKDAEAKVLAKKFVYFCKKGVD